MAKTVFGYATRVLNTWFNAMQDIRFDDLDQDGHYPRLADDALSNAPGNIKPRFNSFVESLNVVPGNGAFEVRVIAGVVTLPDGQTRAIPTTTLTMSPNSLSLVYVNAAGELEVSNSAPATGVLLAKVETDGSDINGEVVDLRPRINYNVGIIGNGGLNGGGGSGLIIPPGLVYPFAGNGGTAPQGYLWCDNASYATSQYPELFAAIGYTWGNDNGKFRVPNPGNRGIIGAASANEVGQLGGNSAAALGVQHLPSHAHGLNDPGHAHGVYDPGHAHAVHDPGHAHGINQSPHSHGVSQSPHGHNISDPGHSHALWAAGPGDYADNDSVHDPSSGVSGEIAGQDSYTVHNGSGNQLVSHNATGIGVVPTNANISIAAQNANLSIYNAFSEIGVHAAGTNIGIYGSGTGMSVQNTGGGQAFSVQNPFVKMRYIIKH